MKVQPTKEPREAKLWIAAVMVVLAILVMTVWFREGERGPLHQLRTGIQTVASPIGSIGNLVTSPVRSWAVDVSDVSISQEDARTLQRQNVELRAKVVELEEQLLRFETLEQLTAAQQNPEFEGVEAQVIGIPVNAWEQVITLNKGTREGIAISMPVVGPKGLLGQVVEVGPNFSKVLLITDRRSGVACMLQRTRTPGIGTGSLSGTLTLEFVANEAEVVPGDVVITSGMGGIYPAGLVVGEVLDALTGVSSLYQTIRVVPAHNINALSTVSILTNTAPFVETAPIGDRQIGDGQ
ncbi:MAG: rod shape-determining protein MreC [Coriobacteriia bacterium]|nr:rod shape-determining protein MreC [Coriobacteriia bacterium]